MSTPAAYLGVIIIWSTTPLAIKWSGEGPGYLFGVTGRMIIGAALCVALLALLRVEFPWHKRARRTYLAASLAIYGAMLSVYWGVQFIPSGLIAVLFGLSPIITSVMAAAWLGERSLTVTKIAGMALGLAGLITVFNAELSLSANAVLGIAAVLISVLLHSGSSVWIKRIGTDLPALTITGGGLVMALPMYALTWAFIDGQMPVEIPARAGLSILYLGVFGSVVGFALYYYVLKHLPVSTIALITLITPVSALLLGHFLNGEVIAPLVWLGTACITLGLMLHHWGSSFARVSRQRQPLTDSE